MADSEAGAGSLCADADGVLSSLGPPEGGTPTGCGPGCVVSSSIVSLSLGAPGEIGPLLTSGVTDSRVAPWERVALPLVDPDDL